MTLLVICGHNCTEKIELITFSVYGKKRQTKLNDVNYNSTDSLITIQRLKQRRF